MGGGFSHICWEKWLGNPEAFPLHARGEKSLFLKGLLFGGEKRERSIREVQRRKENHFLEKRPLSNLPLNDAEPVTFMEGASLLPSEGHWLLFPSAKIFSAKRETFLPRGDRGFGGEGPSPPKERFPLRSVRTLCPEEK